MLQLFTGRIKEFLTRKALTQYELSIRRILHTLSDAEMEEACMTYVALGQLINNVVDARSKRRVSR